MGGYSITLTDTAKADLKKNTQIWRYKKSEKKKGKQISGYTSPKLL